MDGGGARAMHEPHRQPHFLGNFVIVLLSVTPLSLFSNAVNVRHAFVLYPKRMNSNMNGAIERGG